jgi:hypothetical protein
LLQRQAALPYAGTTAAEEPVFNLCEINGGFPGGNIQWNEKVQPVYIFQDSWGTVRLTKITILLCIIKILIYVSHRI